MLGKFPGLVTGTTRTVGMPGARAMVLGKSFDAALPRLTTLQRAEVTRSFRHGIEDALSCMDDVPVSAKYHSTLLQLANAILDALDGESATRE